MATTLTREQTRTRVKPAVIDGDIHNDMPSPQALLPFLPAEWRDYHARFGTFGYSATAYPRINPNAARHDAWPPEGGNPGSSLTFMREQLLDAWNIEYGILNCPDRCRGAPTRPIRRSRPGDQRVAGRHLARSRAAPARLARRPLRGWSARRRRDRPRRSRSALRPGVADRAHRRALGRRKYWPLYEAAVRNDLPIGIHFGGSGGFPFTGAGRPSYYIEDHAGMAQAFQSQVVSLVCEGVFEQFPTLKIVMIEGGFAWLPPLMWRLDAAYGRLRAETPHLKRLPSEYIREHFWITTQPMEEPTKPAQFHQLLDQLGMSDRLIFATDYPHWDFDAPDQAFPVRLDPDLERRIMADNAKGLYKF
jgi:predicted TIM-barrel fold metal-dependent hydrolase